MFLSESAPNLVVFNIQVLSILLFFIFDILLFRYDVLKCGYIFYLCCLVYILPICEIISLTILENEQISSLQICYFFQSLYSLYSFCFEADSMHDVCSHLTHYILKLRYIYITIPCFILCAKNQIMSLCHVSDSLIFFLLLLFLRAVLILQQN